MYKALSLCLVLLFVPASHAQTASPDQVRAAADHAVAIVQRTSANFSKMTGCFSCHNHALPMMMLRTAREHGVAVDEVAAGQVTAKAFSFSPDLTSIDHAVQDQMIIDPVTSDGWNLMAAHSVGVKPNLVTQVYARRVANWQRPDGHWATGDARPPESSSNFTTTAIGIRIIHMYLPAQMSVEVQKRTDRALQWLFSEQPHTTEDSTFRLRGISWGGGNAVECSDAAKDLFALQRPDGGWPQLPHMPSDAYSTGEALTALAEAGGVPVSDPRWQKGLNYLLSTQQSDGSWHVATRIVSPAPVSPPYFESGFPYGHDQYISTTATCWAAMALMQALPKISNPPVPAAPELVANSALQPWMETALFGTVGALKKQLNAGLDPNSQTPEGTTILMMAAHDADKVKLLVENGAIVGTKAKSGFDALMVATTYTGTSRSVKYLLEHGLPANPGKGVQFDAAPLYMATLAGDTDNLDLLLSNGADPNHKMMVLGMFPSSPLVTAVEFGDPAVVTTLLKGKADLRQKDDFEITPLHWATLTHRAEAVKALLAAGADVNAVDKFGYTPLHYAATVDFGDASIVTELLKAGADPKIKDKEGKTAQERGKGYPYVSAALEQAGGKYQISPVK